jgi:pimeloyl-ACP methyl ester carboxylesterase
LDVPTPQEIPLATQVLGQGRERIVLLHGFLGQGKNLTTLARRLLERRPAARAILVDLLGHGGSPALPRGADLETLADGVVPLLGDGAWIVGHSLGGRVALVAAGRRPELVTRLTLLDIAPGPVEVADSDTRRLVDAMLAMPPVAANRESFRQRLLAAGVSKPLVDWQMQNVEQDSAGARWRGHFDPVAMAQMLPRNNAADLWPIVERRAVPIHEVRGERSPYVTDADMQRLGASGARADTIAGVGHFVHTEGLSQLLALMTEAELS